MSKRDATFSKTLYEKRRDLSNAANGKGKPYTDGFGDMSAKDIAEMHGSFLKNKVNVDALNPNALRDLVHNRYYFDNLDTDAKVNVKQALHQQGFYTDVENMEDYGKDDTVKDGPNKGELYDYSHPSEPATPPQTTKPTTPAPIDRSLDINRGGPPGQGTS
jgi:hypothetical protein